MNKVQESKTGRTPKNRIESRTFATTDAFSGLYIVHQLWFLFSPPPDLIADMEGLPLPQ